ncbi:hypothetical protein [Pasteuria penetrans]|uniref:hypothetical protein n=1 Tax=Pasteuria penetrans TaxID=86005 RepID=UPI0011F0841A|nr:hypothetical protein [Pasteuria penetrans]
MCILQLLCCQDVRWGFPITTLRDAYEALLFMLASTSIAAKTLSSSSLRCILPLTNTNMFHLYLHPGMGVVVGGLCSLVV